MTQFYLLTARGGNCMGIYTSPSRAIEHIYLFDLYRMYRGWIKEQREFVWQSDNGVNWYARTPEDVNKPFMERSAAEYEIHELSTDQTVYQDRYFWKWMADKRPLEEVAKVVDMWSEAK